MADHYFTPAPQSEHKPARFETKYRNHTLLFETDSGVFSRLSMDKGTRALLESLPDGISGAVLDMGSGYGALGICLAKANPTCALTMADINERAVSLAAENARRNGVAAETLLSDGYGALRGRKYRLIVSNPPIRAGKNVIYRMFAEGAQALDEGGSMVLVIRKQQGAPSAKTYLQTMFSDVAVAARDGGYWILRCMAPKAPQMNTESE